MLVLHAECLQYCQIACNEYNVVRLLSCCSLNIITIAHYTDAYFYCAGNMAEISMMYESLVGLHN